MLFASASEGFRVTVQDGYCVLSLAAPVELVCAERARLERMHGELRGLINELDLTTPGTFGGEAVAAELRAALHRSGPVTRELCEPPLLEVLERAVALALAPFFPTLADAAAACRQNAAWESLHVAFSTHPADWREMPAQAQFQLDGLAAILAGRVEWTYQGAALPPWCAETLGRASEPLSATADCQGDTVSHRPQEPRSAP